MGKNEKFKDWKMKNELPVEWIVIAIRILWYL